MASKAAHHASHDGAQQAGHGARGHAGCLVSTCCRQARAHARGGQHTAAKAHTLNLLPLMLCRAAARPNMTSTLS